MALWDDVLAEVISVTNRPELTAETAIALRQAVRAAHKSHKFWRDLTVVTKSSLSASDALQTISITSDLPRFRQMAYVKSGTTDKFYRPVDISDLVDSYSLLKVDVYYIAGTDIKLRAYSPETSYDFCYYQYPIVSPTSSFDSWIADEHRDLLVAWAASTVCAMVGEQEIKSRMDQLVAIGLADLVQDNVVAEG